MSEIISIEDQIEEVKRELSHRMIEYPVLQEIRALKREEADLRIARLSAVLQTLRNAQAFIKMADRIPEKKP